MRSLKLNWYLDDSLSPLPILGVFLGIWLPVEWFYGLDMLRGLSALEISQAIAASVIFNFGLFGLIASCLLILGSLATAWLFRLEGRSLAKRVLDFSTWILGLGLVFETVKRGLVSDHPLPNPVNLMILFGMVIGAAGLMICRVSPRIHLRIPMFLGLALVPPSLLLVLLEGAGFGHPPPIRPPAPATGKPDILFITIDALSARHLSLYGYTRETTPGLQAFAKNATTFNRFFANANWTRPGIASILNGVRPWTHSGDLESPFPGVVNSSNLVQRLVEAGYDTVCISTNEFAGPGAQNISNAFRRTTTLFWNPAERPFNFVRWPSLARGLAMGPFLRVSLSWLKFTRSDFIEKTQAPIEECKRLMEEPAAGPRFLWLHLMTVHDPYAAPPPFMGMFEPSYQARSVRETQPAHGFTETADTRFPKLLEGRYDEAVRCLDQGLADLFAWMRARDRFDRTLIVITSDHGESFSHGYGIHGGPLLSEDLLWIPCLIKSPFQTNGQSDSRPMEQVDLAPTLLERLGMEPPKLMEGAPIGRLPEDRPLFAMNRDYQPGSKTFSVAVRKGSWKYVEHFGTWKFPWPARELYDTLRDPREEVNLAEVRPEVAGPLRALILEQLQARRIPEVPR